MLSTYQAQWCVTWYAYHSHYYQQFSLQPLLRYQYCFIPVARLFFFFFHASYCMLFFNEHRAQFYIKNAWQGLAQASWHNRVTVAQRWHSILWIQEQKGPTKTECEINWCDISLLGEIKILVHHAWCDPFVQISTSKKIHVCSTVTKSHRKWWNTNSTFQRNWKWKSREIKTGRHMVDSILPWEVSDNSKKLI